MPDQITVLTDVDSATWIDRFQLSARDGISLLGADNWSVEKTTLRGGLSDGVDLVDLNNGRLSISILPTRGMGIWKASVGAVEAGWASPITRPVNPAYVNLHDRGGIGWLSGFNELICRCGLSSNGPPGIDVIESDDGQEVKTELTLHGRIANIPAHHVEVGVSDDSQGTIWVTGVVDEATMFGPCLRLKSTVSTTAGSNQFRIVDEITNLGGQEAELQLLYHTNIGPPILEQNASFVAPVLDVAPRDNRAADGMESYKTYDRPTVGYQEQVYYMKLATGPTGDTLVMLTNSNCDKAISLRFSPQQLPCFSLWKNTQSKSDGYVTGLEPATNFPNLKTFERANGRVRALAPNESAHFELGLAIHDSVYEIQTLAAEIADLQGDKTVGFSRRPIRRFSPVPDSN